MAKDKPQDMDMWDPCKERPGFEVCCVTPKGSPYRLIGKRDDEGIFRWTRENI